MTDPTPVRIARERIDTIAILRESLARHTAMSANGEHLSYGHSSLDSNDIGLHGEHATAFYIESCGAQVSRIGDEKVARLNGWGDLTVFVGGFGQNIEVKTQRHRDWRRIGRAVNAHQLGHLSARVIVWCVVADELPTESVMLMGWLPVSEVRAHEGEAVVIRKKDYLRVTLAMRSMGELVPWLGTIDPFDSF